MNQKIILTAIAAMLGIGLISMVTPVVLADKDDASNGLEEADPKVHDNTPGEFGGDQDRRFHEGLCQGGHTTDALEGAGGCEDNEPLITDPGESDDNRQDK
jgi:hypothetical protein